MKATPREQGPNHLYQQVLLYLGFYERLKDQQLAKNEGDVVRARFESLRPTGTTVPVIIKTTRWPMTTTRTLAFIKPSGSLQYKDHVSRDKNVNA